MRITEKLELIRKKHEERRDGFTFKSGLDKARTPKRHDEEEFLEDVVNTDADDDDDDKKKWVGGGGNTRLAYGLCKKEGIDTDGMSPKEAWDAYESKTGISAKEAYANHFGAGGKSSSGKTSGKAKTSKTHAAGKKPVDILKTEREKLVSEILEEEKKYYKNPDDAPKKFEDLTSDTKAPIHDLDNLAADIDSYNKSSGIFRDEIKKRIDNRISDLETQLKEYENDGYEWEAEKTKKVLDAAKKATEALFDKKNESLAGGGSIEKTKADRDELEKRTLENFSSKYYKPKGISYLLPEEKKHVEMLDDIIGNIEKYNSATGSEKDQALKDIEDGVRKLESWKNRYAFIGDDKWYINEAYDIADNATKGIIDREKNDKKISKVGDNIVVTWENEKPKKDDFAYYTHVPVTDNIDKWDKFLIEDGGKISNRKLTYDPKHYKLEYSYDVTKDGKKKSERVRLSEGYVHRKNEKTGETEAYATHGSKAEPYKTGDNPAEEGDWVMTKPDLGYHGMYSKH